MFVVAQEDIVAVRRSFMVGGRDHALAELRRRYLGLTDKTAPTVLDRVLAMPVEPVPFAGRRQPRRDGPKSRE